jgi:hypothetical protein
VTTSTRRAWLLHNSPSHPRSCPAASTPTHHPNTHLEQLSQGHDVPEAPPHRHLGRRPPWQPAARRNQVLDVGGCVCRGVDTTASSSLERRPVAPHHVATCSHAHSPFMPSRPVASRLTGSDTHTISGRSRLTPGSGDGSSRGLPPSAVAAPAAAGPPVSPVKTCGCGCCWCDELSSSGGAAAPKRELDADGASSGCCCCCGCCCRGAAGASCPAVAPPSV